MSKVLAALGFDADWTLLQGYTVHWYRETEVHNIPSREFDKRFVQICCIPEIQENGPVVFRQNLNNLKSEIANLGNVRTQRCKHSGAELEEPLPGWVEKENHPAFVAFFVCNCYYHCAGIRLC